MYTIDSYVCPHVLIQRSHDIPCNSHKYKYIIRIYIKRKPYARICCILDELEGALEGLQESLVAYKEAAKRANNPDGA
jgi:hypothetical protein